MAGRVDHFAVYRDRLLDDAAAADLPEVFLEGLGRIAGASGWLAAVELSTAPQLILLARRLAEQSA
jgi:hypothetical protein